MQKLKQIVLIFLFTLILEGCQYFHVYQPPFTQGNIIKPELLQEIRLGMSSQKVETLLGTPVYVDTFAGNGLIYIYSSYKNGNPKEYRKVILTFRNGRLASIDR